MTDRLFHVRQQVAACDRCSLSETRKNSVPGNGSFRADVIFVGEAPGRNEDAHGIPFVGMAGRKLSAALEYSGVTRDEVYITNVVKCRPPDNRVPDQTERETCRDYLQKEIQIIDPKMICIMGNTAFGSILGGDRITEHRGKIMRKNNRLYFVTIHPAAAIYRQELFDVLKSDIKSMFGAITELKNGKNVTVDVECTS